MTLVKWKPAAILGRDFDSLVSDFFPGPVGAIRFGDMTWSPNVDVNETEKTFEINVELPGIKKNEIEVSFEDNILTLKGEKKYEDKKEDKKNHYYYRESGYGKFERSFRMTVPVVEEKISAKYKNGILIITVPKAEIPEPRKVEIK
ncbi:hypothetical protein AMJ80_10460 [bacterium SM23_31]|nr:MAG: hypothetical protein AMJ80_10460 [bacterium SM23_31]